MTYEWLDGRTTYPDRYHCVQFLEDAIRARGAAVEFARDERTEGCYGLIVEGKVMVWLIDNRLPHEAEKEDPAAERLLRRGAFVFCAQRPDAERVGGRWLPIAATPGYAPPPPGYAGRKATRVVFVGYPRDAVRAQALAWVGERVDLLVHQGVFGPAANAAYWSAGAGLNVPTLYGAPYAYDVNMRVFEIAATETPLVTNYLPELSALGFVPGTHCLTYRTLDEIPACIQWLQADAGRARSVGAAGRQLIETRHTYAHRAREVLDILGGKV